MTKSFRAIVEGPMGGPDGDYRKVSPHEIDQEIKWEGDHVPDLMILPDGSYLMKIGRYASPGDRYRFFRPSVVKIDHAGNAQAQ